MNQYSFLLACGKELKPLPEQYRNDFNLVKDCQVKTWIYIEWTDNKMVFYADSESFIIKGILSLISEIYDGHSREEVKKYKCGLLSQKCIVELLTEKQLKGLMSIILTI